MRYGDPGKAERELGFRAATDLRTGLARTIAWTRENRERIERCIAQHRRFMAAAAAT